VLKVLCLMATLERVSLQSQPRWGRPPLSPVSCEKTRPCDVHDFHVTADTNIHNIEALSDHGLPGFSYKSLGNS